MKEYRTPYILTEAGRFADLMKQGFMKPLPKPRIRKDGKAFGTQKPTVTCAACRNWHREGAHTADAATRKINLAKGREEAKRAAMLNAAIDSGNWDAFAKAYPDSTVIRRCVPVGE